MVKDQSDMAEAIISDDVQVLPEEATKPEIVKTQLDYYKESLQYEEEEVNRRSAAKDQELFKGICSSIRNLMGEILEMKLSQAENVAEEVEKNRVQIMMNTLSMRKMSRIQKVRVRMARDNALEARQGVDSVTLQLQGLLYEVLHLQKESQRCLLAHTADKDIELLPLEEFYEQAPESIARPEVTLDDPHQQRLARLHWELEQRRSQTTLTDTMTTELTTVETQISQYRQKIDALGPRIHAILSSTLPLQEALDLPLSALKTQTEVAKLLPMALYTLWMQVSAYGEACDPLIRCAIKGDCEAALKLRKEEQEKNLKANTDDLALENISPCVSDNEGDDNMNNDRGNKRGKRSKTNEIVKTVYDVHPLYIELTVAAKDGSFVMIQFHFAVELRIVTTKCSVMAKNQRDVPGAVVLTNVLNGLDFLDCLFPEDSGIVSPNPSTPYQLKSLSPQFPDDFGRTYTWAQLLGGMSFPPLKQKGATDEDNELMEVAGDLQSDEGSNDALVERVHVTLNAIRKRLTARSVLHDQLMALQSVTSTYNIPLPKAAATEMFPMKVSSQLVSWTALSYQEYCQINCTKVIREHNLSSDRCFFFRAQYQRQHVNMYAYLCVSPNYPYVVPLTSLEIKWGDVLCPYEHIQQLEAEVNVHWPELVVSTGSAKPQRTDLLPMMLYRLAVCLDVYTEALSARLGGGKKTLANLQHSDSIQQYFEKEKIFFRAAKGPDRSFPLKYLPKLKVFAQR